MSHFTVVVCIEDPEQLEAVLARFDENREVEPYRDYQDGAPSAYWAVASLREHEGLNPDDATLTWAQVAEANNRRYDDEPLLLIDDEGRAYSMSERNPDAKWDWWAVGGRWNGYFSYRAEFARDVIHGEPGLGSGKSAPLHCDGGPKRALDLAALRDEKAAEARKTYAEFHALIAGTPKAKSWASFRADLDAKRLTIEEARILYREQPAIQALDGTDFRWHNDPLDEFSLPESLYVERQKARAVPGFATLTMDGRWMAPGRMGWFAMSTDTEDSRIGYWAAANAYIDSLPDDAYLVAVDCHI